MKIIAMLFAAVLVAAGCSGSDSEPAATPAPPPSATDESKVFDRSTLADQAEAQAEQREKALKQLEKSVDRKIEESGQHVDIRIKDGTVTPQGKRIEVKVGTPVTISVISDVAEEIHVHSDPEHTFTVSAGGSIAEKFTVDRPGKVAIEAHHAGVTIVQLVVRP